MRLELIILGPLWCSLLHLERASAFAPPASRSSSRAFTCKSRLFESPEPLATEGDWSAYLDLENFGVVYYFNSKTGESRWEPPSDTFPSVYLKPSARRKAEAKKQEYYKKLQQEEKKKNIVTKLLEERKEEEQLKEDEEPQWMKGILQEKFPAKEEEKPGLFARFLSPQPKSSGAAPGPSIGTVPTPAPAPDTGATTQKSIFDTIFASMTADTAPAPTEPFFVDSGESEKEKEARVAAKERLEAEKKAAEAKTEAERKRKEGEAKKAEEARKKATARAEKKKVEEGKKKAEEEAKMVELVRKAEAQQKAEADRLAAEARKVIDEAKKAEEATKKAEEAKKRAQRAEEAKRRIERAKPGATINLFGLEIPTEIFPTPKKSFDEDKIIVEETQAPITIDMGSFVLPHPSKVMWGGEDAVFIKGRTFGVFDGVSGADKMDGLPLYSKMLATQMLQLVGTGNDLTIKDLQDQLLTAAELADERATGASTALVASITEDGFLRAINLGDSACIVVRGDKIVAKTKEIVHYFDCPYQLSDISPDRPRDARKLNFELLRGDVVLMGSDGIFDNLEESAIVECVNSCTNSKDIAKKVSELSRKVSLNSKAATPYSKQAKRNGDPDYSSGLGGKVDDISCVVARMC